MARRSACAVDGGCYASRQGYHMKAIRNFIQVWLLGVTLFTLPVVVRAQFTVTTNGGAITINSYTGSGGNVIVPNFINGYPVKKIGSYAFSSTPITSVVIPDSVTNIGEGAFYVCGRLTNAIISTNMTELSGEIFGLSGLTSFTFPSGITSIDVGAFDNCLSLTNVVIPSGVQYIGGYAFNDAYSMRSVIIPDSVTNLGDWAFSGCINMTNLIIGNGITSIPTYEFAQSTSLQNVTVPDSVTSVGNNAFAQCSSLTNINYGSGVSTSIGNLRFNGTTSLNTITVSSNNPVLSSLNGVLFDKNQTTLIQCPIGRIGSYTMPNTVTSIWNRAFLNCIGLTDIAIANSITSISFNIFSGCTGITNIIFLDGITNFTPLLFYPCVNLKSFYVSSNNPAYSSINGVLFDKNKTTLLQYPYNGIGNYTVPNGINSIANVAFGYCSNLSNIVFPNSLKNIGQDAFFNCINLVTIVIPFGVTNLESYAFEECHNLASVYFKGNAPVADDSVFTYTPPDPFGSSILPATVYYLAGTTGWSNSLASVSTALWFPFIQTDASLGVNANRFGFNINWASGQTVCVEACSSLFNSVWLPLSTNTLAADISYFCDPQWTNYPNRYYRIRSVP